MSGDLWPELAFTVRPTTSLGPADEREVEALFEQSYREANVPYLGASIRRLRSIALARRGSELAAFALFDNRLLDLPGYPGTATFLAGLACVATEFRRRHLFLELNRLGMESSELGLPALVCGRMAHPASFRGMTRMPSVVPKRGQTPTAVQQAVGRSVADAYGVARFDPTTFVCGGSGRPIGYPRMEVEATAEEWELFRNVDRDRGESLLGVAWSGAAPPDW